jgi:bifunctional non-homologous end joining protein LigD
MKAAGGELPVGNDWVYEIKWDGMRAIAFIDSDGVRLQTTNLLNATVSFPELQALADAAIGTDAVVLDGEIVAAADDGTPSFRRLQDRMHIKDPAEAARRAKVAPVSFIVFDLLHLNGHDTLGLPFEDRRRLLEQLVEPGPTWRLTQVHDADGPALLEAVSSRGLEGLMAKQRTSRYHEGRRSPAWRKVKPRHRQEFVVGGWAEGKQSRTGTVGSLLIGTFENGRLQHAGSVGSGLDASALAEWGDIVARDARDDSPFLGAVPPTAGRTFHWVEPNEVIEVAFAGWEPDGHVRHPSYLGRRIDKDPTDVRREV